MTFGLGVVTIPDEQFKVLAIIVAPGILVGLSVTRGAVAGQRR